MDYTEIFVLTMFLIALPLCVMLFRSTRLPGDRYFFLSFLALLFSNVFTVVEGWLMPAFFNELEHLFIFLSSVSMFIAVFSFVRDRHQHLTLKK